MVCWRTRSVGSLSTVANILRSTDGEQRAPLACSSAQISSSSTVPEPSRSSALNQLTSCRSSAAGSSQSELRSCLRSHSFTSRFHSRR